MIFNFLGANWKVEAPVEILDNLLPLLIIQAETSSGLPLIPLIWNPDLALELNQGPEMGFWKKNDGNFQYQWGQGIYYKISREVVWFYWDYPNTMENYPFIIPFSFWAREKDIKLIHAATIGCDGKWLMLPATSNAGKSTTVASWALHGLSVAGDDVTFLEIVDNQCYFHPIYNFLSLRPEAISRFHLELNLLSNAWFERGDGKKVLTLEKGKLQGKQLLHGIGIFDLGSAPAAELMKHAEMEKLLAHFITSHYLSTTVGTMNMKLLSLIKFLQRQLPFYSIQLGPVLEENTHLLKKVIQSL